MSHDLREQLQRATRDRVVLTREIHHRVKNSLQMIVSLIGLQAHRMSSGEARKALYDTQARVRTIAGVYERLYASPDFGTVSIEPYLEVLTTEVRQSYENSDRVRMDLSVADMALEMGEAIPLALIAHEMLTNAFIHAFPAHRAGTIGLTVGYAAKLDRDGLPVNAFLEVTDSGVGLPAEVDFYESQTMGFELVRILSTQLRGQVSFASGAEGTAFRLVFPVSDADESLCQDFSDGAGRELVS